MRKSLNTKMIYDVGPILCWLWWIAHKRGCSKIGSTLRLRRSMRWADWYIRNMNLHRQMDVLPEPPALGILAIPITPQQDFCSQTSIGLTGQGRSTPSHPSHMDWEGLDSVARWTLPRRPLGTLIIIQCRDSNTSTFSQSCSCSAHVEPGHGAVATTEAHGSRHPQHLPNVVKGVGGCFLVLWPRFEILWVATRIRSHSISAQHSTATSNSLRGATFGAFGFAGADSTCFWANFRPGRPRKNLYWDLLQSALSLFSLQISGTAQASNRSCRSCRKMLCSPKPTGFADHYPYEKWLAIIGNINPTFQRTKGPENAQTLTISLVWLLSASQFTSSSMATLTAEDETPAGSQE